MTQLSFFFEEKLTFLPVSESTTINVKSWGTLNGLVFSF